MANTPETGLQTLKSVETGKLIVRQPAKLAELSALLETFDNLSARVGERVGEDRSGDMGSGAGASAGQTGGSQQDDGVSPRDAAIRKIPASPEVVRRQLSKHIEQEMKALERKAKALSRQWRRGGAHELNTVYSRIRRLNTLLHDILEASYEVLKRLFIRIFIDQQPVL